MAIEIIKTGKLPEEKKYRFDCTNCGTIFTALRKDGEYSQDQREGPMMKVACPICHSKVFGVEIKPQRNLYKA